MERLNASEIAEKFRGSHAVIGVMGLGYVGLPLARAICEAGFKVLGFDIDPEKPELLRNGVAYIRQQAPEFYTRAIAEGRFDPTTDFSRVREADALLICVPTPLTRYREPDLSYVERTIASIRPHMRPGQLIVLESTTYPGTTRDLMIPALERDGLKSGLDFYVAYSPEREDPGNAQYSTAQIPKVVGADGEDALAIALALYDQIVPRTVPVSSAEAAEAVKITENIFRAVNIALVNELKVIYSAMGIDIWEVIEAAKTKPFGYMPFYPGPGLGGHCIPIDPFYLTWKAREHEIPTRFIELAGEINSAMPRHVVGRAVHELSKRFSKSVNGAAVLLVGLAYKKNVDDIRESPGLRLIELFEELGATVDYHDPYVPTIPMTREHSAIAGRRSVELTDSALRSYDMALIATDHDNVDYDRLVDTCRLVVDTRNAAPRRNGVTAENVAKA